MERNYNTYGDLINNKFSELLSADMDTTWKEMKGKLDKEMPESKRKKWLLWFGSKTGILAIVLFTLFASASGAYIGFNQKEKNNHSSDKKEIQPVKTDKITKETVNILHTHLPEASLTPVQQEATAIITVNTPVLHTDKTKNPSATINPKKALIKKKEPAMKLQKETVVPVKDTVVVSAVTPQPQTEVVQARRAF